MARKRNKISVKDLAIEAGIEPDEALIALWDAGFDGITRPNDTIFGHDLNAARRAVGLATRRELTSYTYWQKLFNNMAENEFTHILSRRSIKLRHGARKLPPKLVSILKTEARRQGLDPLTGMRYRIPQKAPVPTTFVPTMVTKAELSGLERITDIERPISDKLSGPAKPVPTVLAWEPPGHKSNLRFITDREVLGIHNVLVQDFLDTEDPIDPPGVRDVNLLASAVYRPHTALGNTYKYRTIESAAAALLHAIILDHPFYNGNKRTALVAMLVFLDEYGFFPIIDQDEAFKLVMQIAQHQIAPNGFQNQTDREVITIAHWICKHTRFLELGNRPLQWRKLRRILVAYGCRSQVSGAHIIIERDVTKPGSFGRKKTTHLKTNVSYGDEGRDVGKGTIKKIRYDLELDDVHGIDSHAFYSKAPDRIADFITEYRKTLRRLAKV